MAMDGLEFELLKGGIDTRLASKGPFALNMLRRGGCWETRAGFGQLAQFDTTMSMPPGSASTEWGYRKHLGSYLIQSPVTGQRQVVSAFYARVESGSSRWLSQFVGIFCVSIYDLTTGARWEEVIFGHTSESASGILPMDQQHGHYETWLGLTSGVLAGENRQDWIAGDETPWFFCELDGVLFMGSQSAGLLAYAPATFRKSRHRFVDSVYGKEWGNRYSESSLIRRVTPVDGVFTDAYDYFNRSTMPVPQALATVGGRLAYAAGNTVYFSDVGWPASVMAVNTIAVPAATPITAMMEQFGALLIFTADGAWHYRPSDGALASAGRLTQLSHSAGCASPQTVARMGDVVVWVGADGVFATQGNLDVQKLSEPIDDFFARPTGVSNPLSAYYAQSGFADTDTDLQYNSFVRWNPDGAQVCWAPSIEALVVAVPAENVALVLSEGEWSLWSFDSLALVRSDEARAGASRTIENPYFVADDDGLYLIGSLDEQGLDDEGPIGYEVIASSYYLLEYGRGGAIDRSVAAEDFRGISGLYRWIFWTGGGGGSIYFDQWHELPEGFSLPVSGATAGDGDTFLVPVVFVPDSNSYDVVAFDIAFAYDSTNWSCLEADFILPPERAAAAAAYSVSEAAGVVTISFDGTLATMLNGGNEMNLLEGKRNLLCYIPFRRIGGVETGGVGIGYAGVAPDVETSRGSTYMPAYLIWDQWTPIAKRQDDSVAQPVDYAYRSWEVGLNQAVVYKLRNVFARLNATGRARSPMASKWPFGPFNMVFSADWKDWVAQVVDLTSTKAVDVAGKLPIRSRVLDATPEMRTRTFQPAGTTNGLRWGSPTNPELGNYLIGDGEHSTIAVSDSVKGESFGVMCFGFIRDAAEKVRLESLRAMVRLYGARRRRGR